MNYCSTTRTNYFHVLPGKEQEFEEFAKTLRGEDEVLLFKEKDKEGTPVYGFGVYGCLDGAADPNLEDGSDEQWEEVCENGWHRLVQKLQEFLAPDDAVIIFHAGNEGLRYISANYDIITKERTKSADMTGTALIDAADILGNPNWDSRCEY